MKQAKQTHETDSGNKLRNKRNKQKISSNKRKPKQTRAKTKNDIVL